MESYFKSNENHYQLISLIDSFKADPRTAPGDAKAGLISGIIQASQRLESCGLLYVYQCIPY